MLHAIGWRVGAAATAPPTVGQQQLSPAHTATSSCTGVQLATHMGHGQSH